MFNVILYDLKKTIVKQSVGELFMHRLLCGGFSWFRICPLIITEISITCAKIIRTKAPLRLASPTKHFDGKSRRARLSLQELYSAKCFQIELNVSSHDVQRQFVSTCLKAVFLQVTNRANWPYLVPNYSVWYSAGAKNTSPKGWSIVNNI